MLFCVNTQANSAISCLCDIDALLCQYTSHLSYLMSLRHGCSSVSSTQAGTLLSYLMSLQHRCSSVSSTQALFSATSCHCNMGALLCLLCLLHRHSSQLSYVSATQMIFCVFYTGYLSYLISLQHGCSSVSIHRLDLVLYCVTTQSYCFDLLCVSTFLLLCSRSQFCSFYLLLSIYFFSDFTPPEEVVRSSPHSLLFFLLLLFFFLLLLLFFL
jgi:hypothetical protein